MAASDSAALVTDPFLTSMLGTSAAAREATVALLNRTAAGADPSNGGGEDENDKGDDAASQAQKALSAHLSHLRSQNRRLAHLLRSTRSHTSTSRSEIDTLHLSLQNLYYESRHLAGEIAACDAFPHKYTQLPLVPEEEFLARFAEWRVAGEEQLMKARIEKEYEERVQLEERRKELVSRKMALVRENATRKEELGKLDTELEAFIDAAKPIQKTFEKEY